MQKQSGKKDAIEFVSPNGFKVILILLTKAVVVQVRIPIVEIGEVRAEVSIRVKIRNIADVGV